MIKFGIFVAALCAFFVWRVLVTDFNAPQPSQQPFTAAADPAYLLTLAARCRDGRTDACTELNFRKRNGL